MNKSERRAMNDMRCASRKLAGLFRQHGHEESARVTEAMVAELAKLFDKIQAETTDD